MRVIPHGVFVLRYRDPNPWRSWIRAVPNRPTVEGVNYLLDRSFRGATAPAAWYVGLIDNAGFVTLADADTHAAHAGWAEFAAVLGGNRGQWNPVAAAGGVLDGVPATGIQVTAAGAVRGALLASRQAVGLSGGAVLYATGQTGVSGGFAVSAGGMITVTYQLRLRPGG